MNIKTSWKVKTAILIFGLVTISTPIFAKNWQMDKTTKDYNIQISFEKDKLNMGNQAITIGLQDLNKKLVTDAQITVEYTMPAMMGMPAMYYKTEAKLEKGQYKAILDFSMEGSWNTVVKIKRLGKLSKVNFNVDVH